MHTPPWPSHFATDSLAADVLFRLPPVLKITGFGRTTFYARIADGLFTPPVKIGARNSAWPASEVQLLNRAIVSGATDAQLRDLVKHLLRLREGFFSPDGALRGVT